MKKKLRFALLRFLGYGETEAYKLRQRVEDLRNELEQTKLELRIQRGLTFSPLRTPMLDSLETSQHSIR